MRQSYGERGKTMKKWLHASFVILVLGVFLFSSVRLLAYFTRYRLSGNAREEAVTEFTRKSSVAMRTGEADSPVAQAGQRGNTDAPDGGADNNADGRPVYAPIEVDFTRLRQVSADAVGWIYCEGTVINYPVVYGRDNEYYLERDYRGSYDPNGAIFTDMRNEKGFTDHNVILYGHHMQDGSMFASLKNWFTPSYYEAHPVMWLLTPEQDYRVEIFAAYPTTAGSDTYSVFQEPGQQLENYLNWVMKWTVIQPEVETGPDGHYIVLSTCAYSWEDARTVLHGKLIPVDSAGGIPLR